MADGRTKLIKLYRQTYRDVGPIDSVYIFCGGRHTWRIRISDLRRESLPLYNRYRRHPGGITLSERNCAAALDAIFCWIFRNRPDQPGDYNAQHSNAERCYLCDKDFHKAAAMFHREVYIVAGKYAIFELRDLVLDCFKHAIKVMTADARQKLFEEQEERERKGERRLRNALRDLLGLPRLPRRRDEDNDDLPRGGGGGGGGGGHSGGGDDSDSDDEDEGYDSDNEAAAGAGNAPAAQPRQAHPQPRARNDREDSSHDLFVAGDSRTPRQQQPPRSRSSMPGAFPGSTPKDEPALPPFFDLGSATRRNPPSPQRQRPGPNGGFRPLGGASSGMRTRMPFSQSPGGLSNLSSPPTRSESAGSRKRTMSTELKQGEERPAKRQYLGKYDISGDGIIKVEDGYDQPPRPFPKPIRRPIRHDDMVIDLTGDDDPAMQEARKASLADAEEREREEIEEATRLSLAPEPRRMEVAFFRPLASEPPRSASRRHRLCCPRCEKLFEADLPLFGNYTHKCPEGPVVSEHSNVQNVWVWTSEYADRRSQAL